MAVYNDVEEGGRPVCVVVEWFDAQRMQTREFLLKYYRAEQQGEMYDLSARRSFLKKSAVPVLPDLVVGTEFVLYSRSLKVKAYADDATRQLYSEENAETRVAVAAAENFGDPLSAVEQKHTITALRLVQLNGTEAAELAACVDSSSSSFELYASEHKVLALTFRGGPVSVRGVAFAQKGKEEELRHLLFERPLAKWPFATFGKNCALCVIKPHVLRDKRCGAVVKMIEASFEVGALQLFKLERDQANEFLEVYDGVLSDYFDHVAALCLGPCLAVEIRGDADVVARFRDACGPWDVDFARDLRPDSIRAKFGANNVDNAVHCTDLPDQGDSEARFFFQLLATNGVS